MDPLQLVVTGKESVAVDTVRLTLSRADGGLLPQAQPGAHIALALEAGVRRYSLLQSGAVLTSYDIGVLRVATGAGGSRFVHDQLAIGGQLRLLDVVNDFELDAEAPHSLLIGGGIGITPLLSMADRLHAEGRSFGLHQFVRDPDRQWPLLASMPASVPWAAMV